MDTGDQMFLFTVLKHGCTLHRFLYAILLWVNALITSCDFCCLSLCPLFPGLLASVSRADRAGAVNKFTSERWRSINVQSVPKVRKRASDHADGCPWDPHLNMSRETERRQRYHLLTIVTRIRKKRCTRSESALKQKAASGDGVKKDMASGEIRVFRCSESPPRQCLGMSPWAYWHHHVAERTCFNMLSCYFDK